MIGYNGQKCKSPRYLVRDVCGPHDAPDLLHRLQVWTQACVAKTSRYYKFVDYIEEKEQKSKQ